MEVEKQNNELAKEIMQQVFDALKSSFKNLVLEKDKHMLVKTLFDGRQHAIWLRHHILDGKTFQWWIEDFINGKEYFSIPVETFLGREIDYETVHQKVLHILHHGTNESVNIMKPQDHLTMLLGWTITNVFQPADHIVTVIGLVKRATYRVDCRNSINRKYNKLFESTKFIEVFNKYAKTMERYPILSEYDTWDIVKNTFSDAFHKYAFDIKFYQDLTYVDTTDATEARDFLFEQNWKTCTSENSIGEILVVQVHDKWLVQFKYHDTRQWESLDVTSLAKLREKYVVRYSETYGNESLYKYWNLSVMAIQVLYQIKARFAIAQQYDNLQHVISVGMEVGMRVAKIDGMNARFVNGLVLTNNVEGNVNRLRLHYLTPSNPPILTIDEHYHENNLDKDLRHYHLLLPNNPPNKVYVQDDQVLKLEIRLSSDLKYYKTSVIWYNDDGYDFFEIQNTVHKYDNQYSKYSRKLIEPIYKLIESMSDKPLSDIYHALMNKYK